jgi:molybdate/tungstate transport system substrate-binding protein
MFKKTNFLIYFLSLFQLFFILSCIPESEKSKNVLKIFHAGSLSVPFHEIQKEFEKENPGVKIQLESAGSRVCARKISELKKEADIMASADYAVIDNLLIPEHAKWNIKFASNEMVVVYTKNSKYSKKINKNNWHEILMKKEVHFGRSDPDSDPCGYRAVLVIKLAEKYYKNKNLTQIFLNKDKKYIRPKETDLLSLLEVGEIDYVFIYRSVAVQHKLKFVSLPVEISLKSKEKSEFYKSVNVKISGKKPGTYITKKGAPMVYGVTIPVNSRNPKLALKFMNFLLHKNKGRKIMEENGQKSVIPSISPNFDKIPKSLQKYAKKQ